jgi:hypothetical protein
MRIGWPGQARLSLVRQSPLLRGRFSFQDEVPGSSPGRPTTPLLTSENTRPLVRGLSQVGSSLVSNKIGGPTTPVSPHGHPDQHVRRLRGGFLDPRGRSYSGGRAHYFTSCRVGRTLREWRRGATRPRVDLCEPLPAVDRSRPSSRTDHQSSSTGPPRWAMAAASTRLSTPSLARTLDTWVLTPLRPR